ncbi:hypothetical protein [Devosia nitrariae]|uniref:HNH endonuclease n=1 Tax=Devosia nitrariae TaxID=2071872 RepID=A0ABQ5W0T6_9HYPH|nr:hypothetical protein [Devosia nitrariae]GLQ53623.1 hypothetical protein GCM10010862_08820 [Devosia nitrariae]
MGTDLYDLGRAGMGKRLKVGPCALCGATRPLTKEHVIPKSLYPVSKRGAWKPIIISACKECNNGSADDDTHLRYVLLMAGETSDAVREVWDGPVRRSFDQPDGRRRAIDVFKLMKSVPDLPGDRYMIYPANDERILRSIRKITRGLCHHHAIHGTVIRDDQVVSDVVRKPLSETLLQNMTFYGSVPEVLEYGVVTIPEASLWRFKFYERTEFYSLVQLQPGD